MLFKRTGRKKPADDRRTNGGTPESKLAGGGAGEEFDPAHVKDFEVAMKKRLHPVVLDFVHASKKRMLHFAEQGFKVFAEDVVTSYQAKRVFMSAAERAEEGGGWSDLERLNYSDEFFDGIYCWYVFNYFTPDDARHLMAELRRVLKVGGVLAMMFADLKNIPGVDRQTIVLTNERFVKKKTIGNRLVKIYENREIESLLSGFRLGRVVTLKNGNRSVTAVKLPPAEGDPTANGPGAGGRRPRFGERSSNGRITGIERGWRGGGADRAGGARHGGGLDSGRRSAGYSDGGRGSQRGGYRSGGEDSDRDRDF